MKRKGFTLVELLVVIAIIALLMSILMPALARVRELAQRVVCGTNCSGIVKAMLVYGNDSDTNRFPRVGGVNTQLGAGTGYTPVPPAPAITATEATITSSLFLLVKFDYTSTKQFVCKSDPQAVELKGIDTDIAVDFGDAPGSYCSYAYHTPYAVGENATSYGLSGASEPGMAVVADRNPMEIGVNSKNHGGDGQNVAYIDAHVKFMDNPQCGMTIGGSGFDNIYTVGPGYEGVLPDVGSGPGSMRDSVLVSAL
jgi:prepilin-type N-terminal cleavage/methylation domain-containing protein